MGGACGTHGGRRGAYRVLMGRPDGKKPLEVVRVDVKIILKLMLKKWDGRHGMD
jgi:hypothetical protein